MRSDNSGEIVWFVEQPGDYPPSADPPMTLLRFPWPQRVRKVFIGSLDPVEFFTDVRIPARHIEFLSSSGWIPLSQFKKGIHLYSGKALRKSALVGSVLI